MRSDENVVRNPKPRNEIVAKAELSCQLFWHRITPVFTHEKLIVDRKALDFAGRSSTLVSAWDNRHSVVDHLTRAAESILLNLAEGARLAPGRARLKSLDYSLGSTLECAACLDIARVKHLCSEADAAHEKRPLCEITKMLIGLRKNWERSAHVVGEETLPYKASSPVKDEPLFHHERLDVYQTSLGFMGWFTELAAVQAMPSRLAQRLDEAATSLILNIAEGNGRYAELGQAKFLDIAESAAVKLAAYLDLSVEKSAMTAKDCVSGKTLLVRIEAMLQSM